MLDARCLILDINDIDPYFIQHPETSIRHRFVYGLKAILKRVSFVKFIGK
jgi:hypothetical protein